MRARNIILTIAAAALVAVALSLAAQGVPGGGPGDGPGGGAWGHGHHRGGGNNGPGDGLAFFDRMLPRIAEKLGLTDEQLAEIQNIVDAARPEIENYAEQLLVLGWLSLNRLPLEFLPSFSSSNISVIAPYRSSSPEEVERLIARPLEDSLSTINGIETLSASAAASSARVRIGFLDGTDMDMAAVGMCATASSGCATCCPTTSSGSRSGAFSPPTSR